MGGRVARSSGRPIAELAPDPHNARAISEEAARGLGASLAAFGDVAGIVWNRRTGQLVAGHQRLAELRRAGAKVWSAPANGEPLGVVVHPKTGERFVVRVVDWTEEQQRAANLASNSPEIAGVFTDPAIAQLEALRATLPDFGDLRLDALLQRLNEELPPPVVRGQVDEDEVPGPPETAISRRGDLWLLGHHRLLVDDCTVIANVARLMRDDRAALMATDPPYGVDYAAVKDGIPRSGFRTQREDWGDIAGDELKDAALQEFLERCFRAATAHALRPNAAWYLWHAHLTQGFFAAAAAAAANVLLHRQIIWRKPHMVLTRSGQYHWQHEPCFYGWVKGHTPPWLGSKSQTSVWEIGRDDPRGQRLHQTQKPVELFRIPMRNHLRRGEIAYEPFAGSGSQMIAAQSLGVRCFALEIEPRYADVIVQRWAVFTGEVPRLEGGGAWPEIQAERKVG